MARQRIAHLEMNDAGESNPTLGRCTMITINHVIY